jgi:uncharacterized phiE125 gp8 family phage protein
MNLKLVTAPTSQPVSLATVKAHLRLPSSYTAEDSIIQMYLEAAVKTAEDRTNRALMEQTWRVTFDKFSPLLVINKTPLISVTSIEYYDTGGTLRTLNSGNYIVDSDSEPWRIISLPGVSFPSTQKRIGAVRITFKAGYASAAAVPKNIVSGILMMVDDLWKNRGTIITGTIVQSIPLTAEKLFDNERVTWL